MNRPLLVGMVISVPFVVWIIGVTVFWYIQPGSIFPWSVLVGLFMLLMVAYSTYFLRPERMILTTMLGEVYAVHAPVGNASRGSIPGTHIVIAFPPRIAKAYILPLTGFTIPFKPIRANAKEANGETVTPVLAFVNLMVRFEPNLRGLKRLVQALPVLVDDVCDLTEKVNILSFCGVNNGLPQFEEIQCMSIVSVLAEVLQPTMDEAVSRAVANCALSEALRSGKEIEEGIRQHLRETLIHSAGMLISDRNDPDFVCSLFDFNIMHISPSDPEAAKAVSSEMTEVLYARGVVAKSVGRATSLKNIAATATTPEGKLALAADAMKDIPSGTQVIVTPDLATAVVGKLLNKNP